MTKNTQETPQERVETLATDVEQDIERTKIQTPSATTLDIPTFGWSSYAERVNGRFAMLGFAAILIIEAFSRDSFLHWAGLIS